MVDEHENLLEIVTLLSAELAQFRHRMTTGTVSFVTLCFITQGALFRFQEDVDWRAAVLVSLSIASVAWFAFRIVVISRTRANYAKCLRQKLIRLVAVPTEAGTIDFSSGLPDEPEKLEERILEFREEQAGLRKGGLTSTYGKLIAFVAAMTILAAAVAASAREKPVPADAPNRAAEAF